MSEAITGVIVPAGHAADSATGHDRAEDLARRWITTKRSPHTRFNYGLDLGTPFPRPGVKQPRPGGPARAPSWLGFCAAAGLDPLGIIQEEHVALWARGMEAAGLSPATVARKLSAVSSWYTWLVKRGEAAANPARELDRPEIDGDVSKTPGLTRAQALALLAAADQAPASQRLRGAALTALLLYTGARVSEACGATAADLGLNRGHRVLWVTRKGNKRQPLALPPPVLERLDAYLASRAGTASLPAVAGQVAGARLLFTTEAGKPLRPAGVWRMIRSRARMAHLPAELVAHLGPHSMRHSFATLYLDAGGNLRDLQDAMGHKDPRTTRRYDRARESLDRSPGYTLAAYLADGDS